MFPPRTFPIHRGHREYLAIEISDYRLNARLPEGQIVLEPLEVRALFQSLAQIEPELLVSLYRAFANRRDVDLRGLNLVRELCELAGAGEDSHFRLSLAAKFVVVSLPRPVFAPPERHDPNKERDELLNRAFTQAVDWIEIEVIDDSGQPKPWLEGGAVLTSGVYQSLRTNALGRHRIAPLPTGECEYRLTLPRHASESSASTSGQGVGTSDGVWKPVGADSPSKSIEPHKLEPEINESLASQEPYAPAVRVPGFARNSSFPTPAVAVGLKALQEFLDADPSRRTVIFGHSDAAGLTRAKKSVSDARAKAALALATSDRGALFALAQAEDWGLADFQAILRALGFIVGAIDGDYGEMTKDALAAYQSATKRRWIGDQPLASNGLLDEATKESLIGAYVSEYGLEVSRSQFIGDGFGGCWDLNAPPGDDAHARAITFALFSPETYLPNSAELPCRVGDASACPKQGGTAPKCSFYRKHIREEAVARGELLFYDFRWQQTPTGKIHLSAITTAPDANHVSFQVKLCAIDDAQALDSGASGNEPEGVLLARCDGLIRSGVCYALWDPGDFDVFDLQSWWRQYTIDSEESRFWPLLTPIDDQAELRLPRFRIEHEGVWAYSGPPGHRLLRMMQHGASAGSEQPILSVLGSGMVVEIDGFPAHSSGQNHREDVVFALLAGTPINEEMPRGGEEPELT